MNLVLIDTSAWIDFFKDVDSPFSLLVDSMLEAELACTCNLVIAELVASSRSRKAFGSLCDSLLALPLLADPPDLWHRVMEDGFVLRRKGVNGVGIPDLVIAAVAQFHGVPVLSKDRHFLAMHHHLGLLLFEP